MYFILVFQIHVWLPFWLFQEHALFQELALFQERLAWLFFKGLQEF